jgi:PKD repeat protein
MKNKFLMFDDELNVIYEMEFEGEYTCSLDSFKHSMGTINGIQKQYIVVSADYTEPITQEMIDEFRNTITTPKPTPEQEEIEKLREEKEVLQNRVNAVEDALHFLLLNSLI